MDCYSQAPGILFNPATNHVIAQNYPDWTMNSPSNPAHPGQQVIVYWTGSSLDLPAAGQVTPTGGPQNQPGYPHTATFGGAPAKVTFVGPTPGFVGLLQFNVEVPDLKPGEYVLDFWEGNSSTQLPGNERLISVGPK
jgi:uncharacterized protein (TIGR03437 family)